MTTSTDGAPELDWVFCFTPLLGGLSHSWRSGRLQDQSQTWSSSVSVAGGLRWCAEHVIGRSDQPAAIPVTETSVAEELGLLGWGFGFTSKIAVVPDGRLAQDVGWLAHHFDDPSSKESVVEWSLALVSEAGRVREAIRIVGPGAGDIIGLLRRDIGVDYSLGLRGVSGSAPEDDPTDILIHDRGSAYGHHKQPGRLSVGREPVPEAFAALGKRFGNGLRFAEETGVVVTGLSFPEARSDSGEPNE